METAQQFRSRPERVSRALKLLYLTLGIGVLRSFYESVRLAATASTGFIIIVAVVTLVVTGFIIYMIGKGRNWARITFLVLFLIGLPFSIKPLLQSLAANLLSGLLGISQIALQLIAIILLFQSASSEWFKKQS